MGLLSTAFTALTLALFALYLSNVVFSVLVLFHPTFHIPLIRPRPVLPTNPQFHVPAYPQTQAFDLIVYLTRSPDRPKSLRDLKPVWRVAGLSRENRFEGEKTLRYRVTSEESAFVHAFLTVAGKTIGTGGERDDPWPVHTVDALVKVMPVVVNNTRRLLTEGVGAEGGREEEENVVIPHGKTKLTLQVVHDTTHYPHAHIPPDLAYRLTFIPTPPYPYLPILAANHMSLKRSDWTPLNLTHPTPTELHLSVSLTSLGMYRLSYTLDTAFARMRDPDFPLHVAEEEIENLRQMVFEVNPTLLAVTVFASMLHMLFEFLALKEDVVHWKRVKYGDEGVSRTTLVLNAVNKVVVVGYLYDKRKETSMLVVGGAVATALVDLWKLTKAFRLIITPRHHFGLLPSLRLAPLDPRTDRQHLNQTADADAVRYILYVCPPLAIAYAVYSLVAWRHEGFYSWALDIAMALVYSVEFIQMLPQILLNHRLRSVEAMPLAAFLFRTVNTFVDDLFAFVIPMPTLTRLSAFRDDVVFIVLLWQWWVYPKRGVETEVEKEEEKDGKKKID